MPQKKNPDVAELIRGKTGRVYGSLVCILTMMKGLPMSYNRDMQEDKEALFDAVDTVKECLAVLGAMLECTKFNRKRMREEAAKGFTTATDVAEYLAMKGVPFRHAHGIVGRLVGYCIEKGKTLSELTLKELRAFYEGFDKSVYAVFKVENSVKARNHEGGTSKQAVLRRIKEIEKTDGKGF
jgi:argininosuccinate lyase